VAKDPQRRRIRLRRTITPDAHAKADADTPEALTRALWGVAAADARAALEAQRQAFATQTADLQSELEAERTRSHELAVQVQRQKERLKALRTIIEVYRSKLAHERAARAVLSTRLMDQRVETELEIQRDQATRKEAAALSAARLGADTQQQHEALRNLVAALYRSIAGRHGVPAGLEVLTQLPPTTLKRDAARLTAQWHQFLKGKKATRTLRAADGRIILHENETIGPENLEAAEREGLLFELILTAKVVERLPDL
jgi:hypothetical protein